MKEAAIAPPGVIPSQQPIAEERNNVIQYRGRSFQTFNTTRRLMLAACPRSASRSPQGQSISKRAIQSGVVAPKRAPSPEGMRYLAYTEPGSLASYTAEQLVKEFHDPRAVREALSRYTG